MLDRGSAGDKAGWVEFLRPVRDRVLDNAGLSDGDTLLDVGAGDGMIAFGALERMGEGGKVVFADVSEDLLDHSRALAEEKGVSDRCELLLAPATDLSALDEGSVDIVTTRSVLIYVGDKRRAFEEFHRVLRPGGRLSIFEPVASFREPEPRGVLLGCDVRAVVDSAEKVKAFYHRAQPRDADPMHDFDERDLPRCAEEAGFSEIRLDYEAVVARGNPEGWGEKAWDILAMAPPNPLVPSLEEVAERVLFTRGSAPLPRPPETARGSGASHEASSLGLPAGDERPLTRGRVVALGPRSARPPKQPHHLPTPSVPSPSRHAGVTGFGSP